MNARDLIAEILARTLYVNQSGFIDGNGVGQDQQVGGIPAAVDQLVALLDPAPKVPLTLFERMQRKSFWKDYER